MHERTRRPPSAVKHGDEGRHGKQKLSHAAVTNSAFWVVPHIAIGFAGRMLSDPVVGTQDPNLLLAFPAATVVARHIAHDLCSKLVGHVWWLAMC